MTARKKRLFAMAESLARLANDDAGSVHQPEDFMEWLHCHIPETDEEHAEDVAELDRMFPEPARDYRNSHAGKLKEVTGAENLIDAVITATELIKDLRIYKRAMDSMAAQWIHPKMTGLEMAKNQLGEK